MIPVNAKKIKINLRIKSKNQWKESHGFVLTPFYVIINMPFAAWKPNNGCKRKCQSPIQAAVGGAGEMPRTRGAVRMVLSERNGYRGKPN